LQDIVDAHVHLSERRDDALIRYARMNELRYTLDELLNTMRRHKIGHGLLLSPPLKGAGPLPNDEIIKLCGRSRGILAPVITLETRPSAMATSPAPTRSHWTGWPTRGRS